MPVLASQRANRGGPTFFSPHAGAISPYTTATRLVLIGILLGSRTSSFLRGAAARPASSARRSGRIPPTRPPDSGIRSGSIDDAGDHGAAGSTRRRREPSSRRTWPASSRPGRGAHGIDGDHLSCPGLTARFAPSDRSTILSHRRPRRSRPPSSPLPGRRRGGPGSAIVLARRPFARIMEEDCAGASCRWAFAR